MSVRRLEHVYMGAREQDFDRLLELENDWDSYGAESIDRRAVKAAKQLLEPTVAPTSHGGVLVWWRWPDGGELEIEFNADGKVQSVNWARE